MGPATSARVLGLSGQYRSLLHQVSTRIVASQHGGYTKHFTKVAAMDEIRTGVMPAMFTPSTRIFILHTSPNTDFRLPWDLS